MLIDERVGYLRRDARCRWFGTAGEVRIRVSRICQECTGCSIGYLRVRQCPENKVDERTTVEKPGFEKSLAIELHQVNFCWSVFFYFCGVVMQLAVRSSLPSPLTAGVAL